MIITPHDYDFDPFIREVEAYEKKLAELDQINDKTSHREGRMIEKSTHLHPFPFNPNGLPEGKWRELGLNDKQIANILNYERKGGQFRKKEDLGKIFTISEEEYLELEPFIVISNQGDARVKQEDKKETINPFPFDPNGLPEEKWKELGLDFKTIRTIKNYELKGGSFKKAEDLKKIHGLKDSVFSALEPYIFIPNKTADSVLIKEEFTRKLLIDINQADSLDLQQLWGIGPSFARRIVKYREALGGFTDKKQLLEVYGMDSSRYGAIFENLTVNQATPVKININTAGIKDLIKHPYIEYYMAKMIVVYRQNNGPFTSVEQIKEANLIYGELFLKIKPYLTIE